MQNNNFFGNLLPKSTLVVFVFTIAIFLYVHKSMPERVSIICTFIYSKLYRMFVGKKTHIDIITTIFILHNYIWRSDLTYIDFNIGQQYNDYIHRYELGWREWCH